MANIIKFPRAVTNAQDRTKEPVGQTQQVEASPLAMRVLWGTCKKFCVCGAGF